MKKLVGLRAKIYSYLTDEGREDKKAKNTEKCFIKKLLNFEDYKNCLEAAQLKNKENHLRKNEIDIDTPNKNQ